MKKTIVVILLSLLCFNLYAFDSFQSGPKNEKAPDFTLQDISGRSVSLSNYSNKAVVLFFWTTWCPNCRKDLSNFNKEYDNLKSSGIELLAIDVQESKAKVESFVKSNSIKYPVLLDIGGNVSSKYKVVGVPTIILISKQGIILSVSHAFPSDYKNTLAE
jgi:peroxiredoxin